MTAWDTALLFLARLMRDGPESAPHEEAIAFFLSGEIDAARRWCWEEISLRGLAPFSEAEENAIRGRFFTADYAYRDAIALFRSRGEFDFRLFSRYDGLFTDLGRALLYNGGGSQEEGAALFARWEAEAAPDDAQRDACIWYIIEMELNTSMEKGIARLEQWADKWHDGDYFADLYDRAAQWAVSRKNDDTLVRLFPAIERGSSGLTRAKYAYIIGRMLEEGRIGPLDRTPKAFFAIAYNESAAPYYYNEAHLYYRAMAGFRLGKEPDFIETHQEAGAATAITTKEGLFLQGFFTYGAKKYAAAWIRDYTETLPLDELRVLAGMLSEEGLWGEAIRLCVVYMKRPDFAVTPWDIALYYPRGYAELVNTFAERFAIDERVLFGLIRTESIFIPDIVSRAGAGGLMQLMPETALDTARTIANQGGPDYVVDDAVDRANPETNIHIGTSFLRSLMDTQASPLHAILSYNGGPNRIRRLARASDLPPDLFMESIEIKETREYGKKVLASAILYGHFYFSLKSDTLIADILGN
jgi:soluble lytic murein transglycosylase